MNGPHIIKEDAIRGVGPIDVIPTRHDLIDLRLIEGRFDWLDESLAELEERFRHFITPQTFARSLDRPHR